MTGQAHAAEDISVRPRARQARGLEMHQAGDTGVTGFFVCLFLRPSISDIYGNKGV